MFWAFAPVRQLSYFQPTVYSSGILTRLISKLLKTNLPTRSSIRPVYIYIFLILQVSNMFV